MFFPGAALLVTTVAFNVLGDSVRDALDPAPRPGAPPRTERPMIASCCAASRGARSSSGSWRRSVFVVYFAVPRDVARLIAGRQASEQTLRSCARAWASTSRCIVQYVRFLGRLVARRPRRVVPHAGAGTHDRRPRLPGDRVARAGQRRALAGGGRRRGRDRGDQAAIADRPRRHHAGPWLLLDADVPGRTAAALLSVLPLYMAGFELFPPGSYVAFSDSPLQWARFLVLPWLSIALVTAPPTRGSRAARCSTCSTRTTSARRARRG